MVGQLRLKGLALPISGRTLTLNSDGSEISIARTGSGERIGQIVIASKATGLLEIESFSIEVGDRGYGAGSEAFELLLKAAAEGKWGSLRARAPADLGLAVYFWMRMGFRPLFGHHAAGGLTLERDVVTAGVGR